jgi:hypothetical protein
VTNASAVFFAPQGAAWEQNQVAPSGGQAECPPATTTYDLRVQFGNGTTEVRSLRVDVQPSTEAPLFTSFTVSPGPEITVGQCVDVRWHVGGDVTNIRVARNETTLWNGAPLQGTSRDCPAAGEAVYSIEATGPGGTSRALQNVTVLAATPGITPTVPADRLPVINSFVVSPNRILPGNCLSVAWSVSGNVSRIQLRRDGVLVLDFALGVGNVTDCPSAEGVYIYRLDAANAQGEISTQQESVTVAR